MWDCLTWAFSNTDKIWYAASIVALWIGSGAFVFRHTKRALERRSSKVNASFEWGSEWQFSNDQGEFESAWEFSSPSLFLFLIGGPILAPFAAFAYHAWGTRHVYARIRFMFRNALDLIRTCVYRMRTPAASVLKYDCRVEVFDGREPGTTSHTMRTSVIFSNSGEYSVTIDGIKASLWSGDKVCVQSWQKIWHHTFSLNDSGHSIDLGLKGISDSHRSMLEEWVDADAQQGSVIYHTGGLAHKFQYRTLPPNCVMRVEYVNARWT